MILPISANVNSCHVNFGAKVIMDARSKELAKVSSKFRQVMENLEKTSEHDVFITRGESRGNSYGDYLSEIIATDMETGVGKRIGESHDYSNYGNLGNPCFYPD